MPLYSSEALILDIFDLHDRDRIVTFLTREQGKKKGVAPGARTKHSRFGGQLQTLAKVHVTWFEKEGRDLGRLSSVELVRPANRLQEDLDGILTGSYLADHMLEFAQENEASDLLYRLLDSTLEALLAGVDRDLAARYFEAWVLRLSGIFPAPVACPECGRALAGGGILPPGGDTLLCLDCGQPREVRGSEASRGWKVGPEAVAFLCRIGRQSLAALGAAGGEQSGMEGAGIPGPAGGAEIDRRALRQSEELCCRVRRQFLQRELRSYEVIQKTRGGV